MAIASKNPKMLKIDEIVRKVAPTDLSVLLTGETGVGKGVVARRIHELSPRRQGPFVSINSAAIPAALLESELYGHQRGAFTGAVREKRGRIETAHKGTLFLDEIGELNLGLQGKLLHLIQDREFTALGSNQSSRVDIRIVAATNRNLLELVADGAFRQDLFFRLTEVLIEVPPLRERPEDMIPLVEHFAQEFSSEESGRPPLRLSDDQRRILLAHDWPGNVRELENFVQSSLVLKSSRDCFRKLAGGASRTWSHPGEEPSLLEMVRLAEEKVERKVIAHTLERNGWHRKNAAAALNISYRSLLSKIKQFELDRCF